ncbi:hypothetical protein Tco_0080493 [Tanacetum coccineum]
MSLAPEVIRKVEWWGFRLTAAGSGGRVGGGWRGSGYEGVVSVVMAAEGEGGSVVVSVVAAAAAAVGGEGGVVEVVGDG